MNGCPVSGSHQTQLIPSSCQLVGTNMSRYWSILLSSVAKIHLSPVMSSIAVLSLSAGCRRNSPAEKAAITSWIFGW